MKNVFVSSTSVDLEAYRSAVRDAIIALGMYPVMMEYFPAMDEAAVAACKQKVLDSDDYVGIYAHRYGFIPQGQTKSITEMEFDWASEQKIPRHIFVVKPDYEWPKDMLDPDESALNAFKARVGKELVWTLFTTPDSLAAKVTESLTEDLQNFSGQARGQRRLVVSGIVLLAVLLLLVAGAVVYGTYVAPVRQANQQATNAVLLALNSTATASKWTPTPSPTPQPLPRLANHLNVIVAGFGDQRADGSIIACGMTQNADDIASCNSANAISDVIADSIRSLPDIGHVADRNTPGVGTIAFADAQQRATAAKTLAEILDADLVIYGLVSASADNPYYSVLTPELYTAGPFSHQEADFYGVAQFGSPVLFLKQTPDTTSGSALQIRIAVIKPFLNGLAGFIQGDYVLAGTEFQNAIDAASVGQGDSDGTLRSLLYVLKGNAALRQANAANLAASDALKKPHSDARDKTVQDALNKEREALNNALGDYDQSLSLQNDYSRALTGRAFAIFQWLVWEQMGATLAGQPSQQFDSSLAGIHATDCPQTTPGSASAPPSLAVLILGCYQRASQRPNLPLLADIDVKTAYGTGQLYAWLALHSHHNRCDIALSTPFWQQAQPYLLSVTNAYSAGDTDRQQRIRVQAAGAYALSGLQLVETDPSNRATMQKAADDYSQAINLLQQDIYYTADKPFVAAYQAQLNAINNWLAISTPPTPVPCQVDF